MEKTLICVGGGELRNKSTLGIDAYCATLAYRHAEGKRPMALFVPTASHDSKPYFNTFRKTYTSVFDIKADLVLTVRGGEMTEEEMQAKIDAADLIYIGGGDTGYMLAEWRRTGLGKKLVAAYRRGVPLVGLSAGAICWFDRMYTDTQMLEGLGDAYCVMDGWGLMRGMMTPHYNLRTEFDDVVRREKAFAYAIEDNCAVHFADGVVRRTITTGGQAFVLDAREGELKKDVLFVQ
jgi:dipeptidase E